MLCKVSLGSRNSAQRVLKKLKCLNDLCVTAAAATPGNVDNLGNSVGQTTFPMFSEHTGI